MQYKLQNKGFSLTEVLMAAGILAIGFAFIAGMFPVGVKLTALATEQTIAPIVVDEAIAKMKLYGELYSELVTEPNLVDELEIATGFGNGYVDFADVLGFDGDEFTYPSTDISPEPKKYHWSALCGLLADGNVHVSIFVSRRAGAGAQYLTHNSNYTLINYGQAVLDPTQDDWPVPVRVGVGISGTDSLIIDADSDERAYISTGSTIVDDATGLVYRVLERILEDDDIVFMLDRDWEGPVSGYVWVVPPAVGSGRNPCIGVYQKVIGF